ncbi:hypothetical protein ROLI_026770 [Roseobacter fucihabitans]|uniref:Transposase n=1 Tax=Roseobacter fucihabitans TaxID=1537242 RepID=A0ABZ2BU74_9RHOB|nr:hypothetical protein [Roseobacter litoralis]MBC6967362.1 hypothetical protein [Roseobacter litoralis]
MTLQAIGVDVSKVHLDVHSLPDGRYAQFENDMNGFRKFLQWAREQPLRMVIFEPTGGLSSRIWACPSPGKIPLGEG